VWALAVVEDFQVLENCIREFDACLPTLALILQRFLRCTSAKQFGLPGMFDEDSWETVIMTAETAMGIRMAFQNEDEEA
jgi:hypothetical protein